MTHGVPVVVAVHDPHLVMYLIGALFAAALLAAVAAHLLPDAEQGAPSRRVTGHSALAVAGVALLGVGVLFFTDSRQSENAIAARSATIDALEARYDVEVTSRLRVRVTGEQDVTVRERDTGRTRSLTAHVTSAQVTLLDPDAGLSEYRAGPSDPQRGR